MGTGDTGDVLTRLIDRGEDWDPVEEQTALAQIQADMFSANFEPFALSRYVMLEPLGSGGAGIVYRAYDPDLHRQVAVKVLRTGEGSTAAASSARLLREAQAIAQLSHPNVVSVFDVGTLDDHAAITLGAGVFMVMELIEGVELRSWLTAEKRSWRAILGAFVAAGRGLEAAHARGIVHRDFKPANVLVADDGRVRVLDFGLARAVGREGPSAKLARPMPSPASREPFDEELTDAGTVMGTPRYMAPEQHLGESADARTDQFCFCVALHEALSGASPFGGATLEELAEAKKAGPSPVGGGVPRWLSDAVMRGLAVKPQQRFESMSALLDALDRDPARKRRRVFQIGALAVAVGLGAYALAEPPTRQSATCEDPSARLTGVWDETSKSQARKAFAATDLDYANDTFSGVEAALDEYALAWKSARTETCEATLVDGSQAPEVMALQMLCLDQQFESFAELARILTQADEPVVRNAVSATSKLPSPSVCRSASARLEQRLDLEGHGREDILALDAQLLRASVLSDAGKYDETRALADAVLHRAEDLGAHRTQARAHLMLCNVDWLTNHFVDAQKRCETALVSAERGQSDPLAFEVLTVLARVTNNLGTYGEAERIYSIARARLQAIPREQRPDLATATLDKGMGLLRDQQWREAEAREYLQRALVAYEEQLGPKHPELVSVLNGLGMVAAAQEREDAAIGYYERALEITGSSYGPTHPYVAGLLNNVGGVELERGRLDDALGSLSRALELKEAHLGPDSPRLVTTLGRMGQVLADMGRGEEALVHHARAVRLQEAAQGEASHLLLSPLMRYARTLRILGRCDEALELIGRAKTVAKAHSDSQLSSAADIEFEQAHCALLAGDPDRALASFERALVIESGYRGSDGRGPARVLVEIAEILERRGDVRGATERLEDAQRRCETNEGDPRLLARVKFARARVVAGSSPELSRGLAREAQDLLKDQDYAAGLQEAIAAWMKKRTDG